MSLNPLSCNPCSSRLFQSVRVGGGFLSLYAPVAAQLLRSRVTSRSYATRRHLRPRSRQRSTLPAGHWRTMSSQPADKVEAAKRAAAFSAVADHFSTDFKYVGIGSGSTVVYVVDAIKEAVQKSGSNSQIQFIPTGSQSKGLILKAGLTPLRFDELPEEHMMDVAFDGADEVDEDFNCIKGGGACLYQEKLVATRARKFICVADYRKDVERLLTDWTYVPVEVEPLALNSVLRALTTLGCPNPELRKVVTVEAGPLKTDQNFFIVKAPFPKMTIARDATPAPAEGKTSDGLVGRVWSAPALATQIKAIGGVLDVGIFTGMNGIQAAKAGYGGGGQKPIAVYFGMSDGTVKVRKSAEAQ